MPTHSSFPKPPLIAAVLLTPANTLDPYGHVGQ